MASPSLAFFLVLFLHSHLTLPLHAIGSGGFSVELIHRGSPKSPSYDPSLTLSDRLRAAVRHSRARARRFRRASSLAASNDPIQSEVIPNSFEYLMAINVGSPATKILAIADTGSDLTWTNCRPCDACYEQEAPLFNPEESSTYREHSCEDPACLELPLAGCGRGSACRFHYTYGDRSYTFGDLASETFVFNATDGQSVAAPNLTFGCAHESNGTFDSHGAGLVGLGGGPLSLISQLSSSIGGKFSYCLVPFSHENTSTSQITFGANAVVVGRHAVSTPLIPGEADTFYTVSLEDISVGHEKISAARGSIVIDSGTTLTLLDRSMFQLLASKLTSVIALPQVSDPDGSFDLCFKVNGPSDAAQLPVITFEFSGAPLPLGPANTFVQVDEDVTCLAIVSSDSISIFGNIAQQNLHVGYDLVEKKLSFAAADCTKL